MTLKEKQKTLETKIYEVANDNNLLTDNLHPICDGVCDFDEYLKSSPKIMWILKEPYDDFVNGKPSGGGWSIPMDCFEKDDVWKSKSWQSIIYVVYGFLHNLKWNEMDYIKDDKSMAEVLKQIAYINMSKMPAYNASNDNLLYDAYKIWKDILFEQITTYSPDIIIFGNTFKYFQKDLIGSDINPIKAYDDWIDVYKKDKTILLDAYHPSRKGCDYVDSLITALQDAKNKRI